MARSNRVIYSGGFYEVIFKARKSLPLPALRLIEFIILSALARTQRDDKVILCHYLWMGNHAHLYLIAQDAQELANFLQELQKKLTESIKRLLGKNHLNIWQGSAVVALIVDPEKAAEKIAYGYANPAKANLVNMIDDYPGVSTWSVFRRILRSSNPLLNSVDTCCSRRMPWIRLSMIPKVSSDTVNPADDRRLARSMLRAAYRSKEFHDLKFYPNAWMGVFGIKDPKEILRWNREIIKLTRQMEAEARSSRKAKKQNVMGAKNLIREKILKPIKHKRAISSQRRVFVIGSDAKLRAKFISQIKSINAKAAALYKPWLMGTQVRWPPGVFRPPLGPSGNRLYQTSEPLMWMTESTTCN